MHRSRKPKFVSRPMAVCAALLCTVLLGACRDSGDEQLFAMSGKLFEFNYRLGIATYVVTLKPLRPVGEGQVAVVSFQNPAGGDPLVVNQKIWPKLPHVTLTSPPLKCVVKDKPYSVSIRIKDASGAVLQSFDTTMTSSLDQSVLPDRPLVIGPVYELNKDLVGHADGKLPGEPKPDCSKAA